MWHDATDSVAGEEIKGSSQVCGFLKSEFISLKSNYSLTISFALLSLHDTMTLFVGQALLVVGRSYCPT